MLRVCHNVLGETSAATVQALQQMPKQAHVYPLQAKKES